MAKWKKAFLASLGDADPADFQFGPPATEDDLAKLEKQIGRKIPKDLRALLKEFNGITARGETYFFPTKEMPSAAEYYRKAWGDSADLLLECSRHILYVCQENGLSEMWGVVFKPFEGFERGQIVAFDHDNIMSADSAEELFASPYESLQELLEASCFGKSVE